MKKILSIIGIVLVVLLAVILLALGPIIKGAVTTMGPKLAGVPIELKKVTVNPFSGLVQIKGLVIGNPEGFHTPSAMELGEFKLDIAMGSLFTDTIVIKKILISDPQITYEKALRTSNLAQLQENLAPKKEAEPAKEKPEAEPKKEKGKAKKVIIEDFQLNGAKLNVTITALGGKKLSLPLPPINMKDIGKSSGGASPAEVISEVFNSILSAAKTALAKSGDIAGDALKDVSGAAGDAVKSVGGTAGEAADKIKKGIGSLFGK